MHADPGTRSMSPEADVGEFCTRLVQECASPAWWIDASGAVTANAACVRFSGLSLAEIASGGWLDVIHPADRRRVVATREPLSRPLACRVRTRSGEFSPVVAKHLPMRTADGSVVGWFGILDSAGPPTAIATEDSDVRVLSALTSSAPAGMALLDLDGRFVLTSRTARGPHGVGARVGQTVSELFPDVWRQCERHFRRAVEEALPVQFTVSSEETGSPPSRTWEIAYFPVQADAGEVLGVLATTLDVSERARADERAAAVIREIERQRAVFEAIFAESQVGKALLDRQGRFMFVNEALATLHGIRPDEHLGRRLNGVLPAEMAAPLQDAIEEVVATSRPQELELSGQVADGGEARHWLVSLYPIHVGGEPIGLGMVVLDMSAHRAAEIQLRALNERMSEYVAVASHEIRRPLTSFYGYGLRVARLIESPTRSMPALREAVETLVAESERLSRTVDLFLDLALVESGQFAAERSNINLNELLVLLLPEYRRQYPAATILLALSDEPVVARANAVAVTQIISNLLVNAASYAGEHPRIRVALARDDRWCIVRVADDGPGLAPDVRPRLFDRYFRGPARDRPGLGVGLYISKRLARDLGGDLVATDPPDGAEFVLTLQRA